MPNKDSTIKTYTRTYKSGKKYKMQILNCICCNKELKIRSSDLKQHKGKCSSCAKRKLRSFEYLYNTLCRGAEKKKIPVSLTYEEFLTFTICEVCYYCNSFVEWNEKRTRQSSRAYNLDRKDNSKGYSKDNLAVCCKKCNKLKSDKFTSDEFRTIQLMLRIFRKSKSDADEAVAAIAGVPMMGRL